MDSFAQRFLLASLLAWRDAGGSVEDPARVGIVVATGYGPLVTSFGFLNDIIELGDELGSPFLFSASVHNAPASVISSALGVQGPCLTVTAFAHAAARAIGVAFDWLEERQADRVLVAAGDEFHEVLGYCLLRIGDCPADGRIHPYDFERCTYVPGETFAAMVLARGDEGPAPWGYLERPSFFRGDRPSEVVARPGPVFLSAKGEKAQGGAYRLLARAGRPVAAYTPLWGASPTSDAMTVLAAAVCLRDRTLYETPFAGDGGEDLQTAVTGPLADPYVHCVTRDLPGEGVVLTVHARL
jgi:3-oxoacyl-[acyl-carrier-protein] synthase II